MSAANGSACHDMMNRVMTKDNIGLVAFLETKEEIYAHTFANGKFNFEPFELIETNFFIQEFYRRIIIKYCSFVLRIFTGILNIVT